MEKQCLRDLLNLINSYSSIYRGPYLPSRIGRIAAEHGSEILRESLADHVGALPIVATFLYPYIGKELNLGKVLTMLAIHDIGEIVVGDVLTVKRQKTSNEIEDEKEAALSLLHPYYHPFFKEFETNESLEAKFAHSIDKISPNLYELIIDKKMAKERHAHFGFDIVQAVENDKSVMTWNEFLTRFYDELIHQTKERFADTHS